MRKDKKWNCRPGFLMCIAYIDPGNLEADLQTGVKTGYGLLWVLLWSTLLGYLLQSLAAKLGVSTMRHLAQHCRDKYPTGMRMLLWIMAELAIIGSDMQEVIGSALALILLTGGGIPLWAGVLIGAVSAYLFLFLEKFGLRWLETFIQALVAVLGVCMTVIFFVAEVPYGQVMKGLLVPTLSAKSLPTATGLLGAVIMPHNLFLHSALVHERGIPIEYRSTTRESLKYYKIESAVALLVTLGINTAVISVFSHGFHSQHKDMNIGLQNAGEYLGRRFGSSMAVVWAIGLLAAGQSSTMTGTYAGQFVMSGFLNLKINAFKRSLITRAVALVPTLFVALSAPTDNSSLDVLNQWINILQAIQLPFATIPLLALTSDASVVGLGFVNSKLTQFVSWATSFLIIGINAGTAYQTAVDVLPRNIYIHVLFATIVALYLGAVILLLIMSRSTFKPRLDEERQGSVPRVESTSIRDSLLVVNENEEMDVSMDEEAVQVAGAYVLPSSSPVKNSKNLTPRSNPVSVASSRPLSSRQGALSSHAIDEDIDRSL